MVGTRTLVLPYRTLSSVELTRRKTAWNLYRSIPSPVATMHTVIFEPLYSDVALPKRATEGAAGYDVYAYLKDRRVETILGSKHRYVDATASCLALEPGMRAAIPLGFRATLPTGLEAQLRLRSSSAFQKGLMMPNAPATIDPDYPQEWMVLVTNTLAETVKIQHLERIAQIVFSRFELVDWKAGTVVVSSDRIGGIGSTGR